MFTGIIEEIGKIKSMLRGGKSVVIEVEAEKVLKDTKIGDSIATNGVCLTVTFLGDSFFRADVMPETMRRSNLGLLRPGGSGKSGTCSLFKQSFGRTFGGRTYRWDRPDRGRATGG